MALVRHGFGWWYGYLALKCEKNDIKYGEKEEKERRVSQNKMCACWELGEGGCEWGVCMCVCVCWTMTGGEWGYIRMWNVPLENKCSEALREAREMTEMTECGWRSIWIMHVCCMRSMANQHVQNGLCNTINTNNLYLQCHSCHSSHILTWAFRIQSQRCVGRNVFGVRTLICKKRKRTH